MATMTSTSPTAEFRPGLEGVIAAETRLSRVDGEKGELWIAGYPVESLAPAVGFEETVELLWSGELPTQDRLAALRARLAARRGLPASTLRLLELAAEARVGVMDALRMGAASLDLDAGADGSRAADTLHADPEALRARAEEVVARFPSLVAAYWRLLHGKQPVAPDEGLGHAANYLYMLTGEPPSAAQVRGLETYLNTVVDHGMNASTFTARVIVSTRSDLISAVTGAVGALKGPLHGGAPGPALDMVFEIGSAERAEPYLREKVASGERLMGFGHRVYKVYDPRAAVLAEAAEALYRDGDEEGIYRLAKDVEQVAMRVLAELKPGRRLETNVEYYTALLLHGVGLESALFTPTFAVSRVAGWIAHCFEQLEDGRLLRPRAAWVGEGPRPWPPRAAMASAG